MNNDENKQNYINPERFSSSMRSIWTKQLDNIYNAALGETWYSIAEHYQKLIQNHDNPGEEQLTFVLSPPTGSGKTIGTICYCAWLTWPEYIHPGVLIITQRVEECKYVTDKINEFGKRDSAIAYYSEANVSLNDLPNYDTLVITHEMYKRSLEKLQSETPELSKIHKFLEYKFSGRALVIIDESISIIQSFIVGLNSLRKTLAVIEQHIRDRHPEAIESLEFTIEILAECHEKHQANQQLPKDEMLKPGFTNWEVDFTPLLEDLRNEKIENMAMHAERLNAVAEIMQGWFYYHNSGKEHTLHFAKSLLPKELHGVAILDATAWASRYYEVHDNCEMVPVVEGTRNYRNFTLHVSRGHKTGKGAMIEAGSEFMEQIMTNLRRHLKGRNVLGICHRDAEHWLAGANHDGFTFKTNHYFNINGSNEYRNCDTILLLGLPYKPDSWATNVFMAVQGPQSTDWLRATGNRPWKNYPDIKRELRLGAIASDIIQAINRIRTRKVISVEGDCPKSEGFILLPKLKQEADFILTQIRKTMPGINIKEDWKFGNSSLKVKPRESNKGLTLISYLKTMEAGEMQHKAHVANKLQLSSRTMATLIKKAQTDPESKIAKALVGLNIEAKNVVQGRTRKTFFIRS